MANPFDPRAILLAKHAQHVVLVHFPIALFLTGVVFDLAARFTKSAAFATAAYFNIIGAAVTVVPVLASGILAWQWQLAGQRLKGILLLHLVLGWLSGVLICAVATVRLRSRASSELSPLSLPLQLAAATVIALTAHLGGFLSGVMG